MSALEARGLAKTYRGGAEEVSAVRGASLALEEGELVPVSYTHLTLPTIYSV